jgi:hypothetical protein
MIAHLFLLPIDGCSINPSRSFGPSLVATWAGIKGDYYRQHHIFWFGPLFGAAVAAIMYEYLGLKPVNFAGAKDMDTSIFQSDKSRRKSDQSAVTHLKVDTVKEDEAVELLPVEADTKRIRVTFQDDADVESPIHTSTPAAVTQVEQRPSISDNDDEDVDLS